MKEARGSNNAETLFGIKEIPSDTHIRRCLGLIHPFSLSVVFDTIFSYLKEAGELEKFKFLNDQLLIAFDGTEHTSSHKIHCNSCSRRNHRNGETTYFHSALTPVIVQPGNDKVISLPPEFIIPQDGANKQDCEQKAFGRWLDKNADKYREHKITVLGDDLYCALMLEQEEPSLKI